MTAEIRASAVVRLLYTIGLFTSVTSLCADEAVPRLPVPDQNDQAKTLKLVHEAFSAGYAKREMTDRKQLAHSLFEEAQRTKDDPTAIFVLLSESMEISAAAGDLDSAIAAADELDSRFQTDRVTLRLSMLSTARGAVPPSPEDQGNLCRLTLSLGDDALSAGNSEVAAKAASIAEATAHTSHDASLIARAGDLSRRSQEISKLQQDEAAERQMLREHPGNTEASVKLGRILCFARGKWDEGLPLLQKTTDPTLSAAVRQELSKPTGAPEMAKAADAWWHVANGGPVPAEDARQRAAYWYQKAIPDLDGLGRAVAQKRIADATPRIRSIPVTFATSRFAAETPDQLIPSSDREIPDELSVVTSNQQIRIFGAKRTYDAQTSHGTVYHYGKAVVASAKIGEGSLRVGVPWSYDHADYYFLLAAHKGQVSSKEIHFRTGVEYRWRVYESAGDTMMSVMEKDEELASVKLETRDVEGFGFAVVVRYPKDKADLLASIKK